jgi:hypothetical protein
LSLCHFCVVILLLMVDNLASATRGAN